MKFFSSSATNKVDAKGRVSIPAPFRKVLGMEDSPLLFLMPEVRGKPAIEGFGQSHFEKLADSLEKMNPLSAEYDALADVDLVIEAVFEDMLGVQGWFEPLRNHPYYIEGEHRFSARMWEPLKRREPVTHGKHATKGGETNDVCFK